MQIVLQKLGNDIYGTKLPVYFEAWIIAQQSALPTYLVSLAINFIGFNLFAIRLPVLIISIISIIIIYLLGKELFNKKIAILILFLTAINPWHIMQSQWNLDCNLFPHLFLISTYLLYSGVKNSNKIKLYLSILIYGLSMYAYGISIFIVPVFLIILGIILIIKKKIVLRELLFATLIYILVSLPILIMYFINYFKLDSIEIFGITIQRFYGTIRGGDIVVLSNNILEQLKNNFICLFQTVILQYDGLIWNGINGFGTLYYISIPFIFIAIAEILSKKNEFKYSYIILLWFLISIFIGIVINDININRLNIIWYPMIILNGYGIYVLWKLLHTKKYILFIIIGSYIVLSMLFIYKYYTKYQKQISGTDTFSKGIVEAFEYINNIEEKVVLSKDIDDISNYIYLLYVNKDNNISRAQLIRYYLEKNNDMEFYKSKMLFEDFNDNKLLTENVYMIKRNQVDKVLNIIDYETREFGEYVVLTKIENGGI